MDNVMFGTPLEFGIVKIKKGIIQSKKLVLSNDPIYLNTVTQKDF
jgi:hypothetical protein